MTVREALVRLMGERFFHTGIGNDYGCRGRGCTSKWTLEVVSQDDGPPIMTFKRETPCSEDCAYQKAAEALGWKA